MLLYKQNVNKRKLRMKEGSCSNVLVVVRLCVAILSSSFLQVSFIVRDGEVSVERERESKTCSLLQAACSAFCRVTVTACTKLFSPMYYLSVTCTFTIDF